MISTSWYSCPFVIPSSWMWVGPNDFLLLKRTYQKQQNVPSEIILQKDSSFHLGYALLVSHLLTLMEPVAILWAALWKSQQEVGLPWRNPKKRVKDRQQPVRNWVLPTTTWITLELDLPPIEPWENFRPDWHLDCSLGGEFEEKNLATPCCILHPQKL